MKYSEFWPWYLSQHTRTGTKILHLVGLSLWLLLMISGMVLGNFFLGFASGVLCSYSCAFVSHLIFEHNNPATFKHPIYSIISDFRMAYYFITGRFKT